MMQLFRVWGGFIKYAYIGGYWETNSSTFVNCWPMVKLNLWLKFRIISFKPVVNQTLIVIRALMQSWPKFGPWISFNCPFKVEFSIDLFLFSSYFDTVSDGAKVRCLIPGQTKVIVQEAQAKTFDHTIFNSEHISRKKKNLPELVIPSLVWIVIFIECLNCCRAASRSQSSTRASVPSPLEFGTWYIIKNDLKQIKCRDENFTIFQEQNW